MKMTDAQLQSLAKKVYHDCYRGVFNCDVAFMDSKRLAIGGYFHPAGHTNLYDGGNLHGVIRINPRILTDYKHPKTVLIKSLKHELTHYELWVTGRSYRHTPTFKYYVKSIGGYYHLPLGKRSLNRTVHLYRCTKCGYLYPRIRKINASRLPNYYCSRDKGSLKFYKNIKRYQLSHYLKIDKQIDKNHEN